MLQGVELGRAAMSTDSWPLTPAGPSSWSSVGRKSDAQGHATTHRATPSHAKTQRATPRHTEPHQATKIKPLATLFFHKSQVILTDLKSSPTVPSKEGQA